MNRRGFLGSLVATAGGLLVPWEPERVYSFIRRPRIGSMLRIFDGMQPLSADGALTGNTLISEIPLSFWKISRGVGFFAPGSLVDNTGRMNFARLYDPYGLVVADLSVATDKDPPDTGALLMNRRYVSTGEAICLNGELTTDVPGGLDSLLG